jgi:hypothetical protein
MTPVLLGYIVGGIEQLVAFLVEAHRNGQISDADLETATNGTNLATRQLIADALGKQKPAI